MLLSSTQQRLRSEIWRYTPSSVAPSEPLVRQLQGTYVIPGQPLGLQGNLFSHLSYTKIGFEMSRFL